MSRVGGNSVSVSGRSPVTRTGNVPCPSPRRARVGVLFQVTVGRSLEPNLGRASEDCPAVSLAGPGKSGRSGSLCDGESSPLHRFAEAHVPMVFHANPISAGGLLVPSAVPPGSVPFTDRHRNLASHGSPQRSEKVRRVLTGKCSPSLGPVQIQFRLGWLVAEARGALQAHGAIGPDGQVGPDLDSVGTGSSLGVHPVGNRGSEIVVSRRPGRGHPFPFACSSRRCAGDEGKRWGEAFQ